MADDQKPKAKKTKSPEAKNDAPAVIVAKDPVKAAEPVPTPPPPPRKAMKPTRLQKKNNPHLPRKLKKAQKKAAEAQARV